MRPVRELLGAGARLASKLCHNTRGVIALKFAMAVPGLAVLVLGSVDLYAVQSDRSRMQDIADAAALAGARELGLAVDAVGPEGRALAYIEAQISGWSHGPTITPDVEVITLASGERALRAALHGNRPSFFGNMLPPGGWDMDAEATATSIAVTPLCVLVHSTSQDRTLNLKDQSQIRAPACLIHSNREVKVENVARITAASVQAVTRASGSISPAAQTGAAVVQDPFADLPIETTANLRDLLRCTAATIPQRISSGRHVLQPGVHCDNLTVDGTAELVLAPGEHWFLHASLQVKEDGRLSGTDVVLFFDKDSRFQFQDRSTISLEGRESGQYAGMVMIATRDNTQDFVIWSDHVETLLGVIYVPRARLIVQGTADVARESAWTVIVAQRMELKGAPSLFINADYDASDVPVPGGVGPTSGGSRLLN
ncbi:pilus assembly protein TadG-related protein [Brevundimonas sp.]|uniref:pilus assembly protein TadG-related protein n=1 Tax=Brevundimonas sp. TaxID=1871086 RepID=UPI0025D867D2|nr:pilus assembly protein TadG-related protein [Brevundimonas sp.]